MKSFQILKDTNERLRIIKLFCSDKTEREKFKFGWIGFVGYKYEIRFAETEIESFQIQAEMIKEQKKKKKLELKNLEIEKKKENLFNSL